MTRYSLSMKGEPSMNPMEIQKPAASQQTGKIKTYAQKYSPTGPGGKAPRLSLEAALALASRALPCLALTPHPRPPVIPICWRLPKVVA